MDKPSISEEQIIDQAIKGEESAYGYLLEKHKTFAFTVAMRVVGNKEDAEEIVQDSFIKAFNAIKRFKRSGKFSTWLYKIIYHTALTSIRGKKVNTNQLGEYHEHQLSIPDSYANGFDKMRNEEQLKYLGLAISQLDEASKLAITLYYSCECTISEINEITGWNVSTIKIRLFRARQKIYTELSKILNHEMKDLL